jgi:hypothetical protein
VVRLLSSADLREGDAAPLSNALFLVFTFALPLVSDDSLAAGGLPIVWLFSCFLSASGAVGAACPVVSGVLIWLDFNAGATVSAGAFCCAVGAGAGASSVFTACADTTPAPSSNIAAVVDINRRFLMDFSFGRPKLLNFRFSKGNFSSPRLSQQNRLPTEIPSPVTATATKVSSAAKK